MHTEYAAIVYIGDPIAAGPLTQEWNADRHFETAEQAWQALADYRVDLEDEVEETADVFVDRDVAPLMDGRDTGSVWMADPGHDDSDDMHAGRTYSVVAVN
jgi:hypothetical protein